MMRGSFRWLMIISAVLAGCWGLPEDFASLPLDAQIEAYEHHFRRGGHASSEARAHISWHGVPAANAMIGYLNGTKHGIPAGEAVFIVWDIQLRGCDLKDTAVPKALQTLIKNGKEYPEVVQAASTVLGDIRDRRHVAPGRLDQLSGGPCERAQQRSAAK